MRLLSYASTPLQFMRGVGPLLAERFEALSLRTYWDCLSYLPREYDVYRKEAVGSQKALVAGRIVSIKKGRASCQLFCDPLWPEQNPFSVLFFRHYPKHLPLGGCFVFGGSLVDTVMTHPEETLPWKEGGAPSLYIRPVYGACKGLSSKKIHAIVIRLLEKLPHVEEWLDPSQKAELNWPTLPQALTYAHAPTHLDHIDQGASWRGRLAFDECVAHHIVSIQARAQYRERRATPCASNPLSVETVLRRFGHPLTACQKQAWDLISKDLESEKPMMRLVHGEVGSGKTLLAVLALVQTALSGKQGCLLAPTELLARQHAATLAQLLPDQRIGLLLAERKEDLSGMASGDIRIVVGTHALFQDPVQFASLALVVIDEQQRFGVEQRLRLTQKGSNPHLLLMSATPIPRTFELALMGTLEVSKLVTRPSPARLTSYVLPISREGDLMPWIQKCVSQGELVYWVCPTIGETEEEEGTLGEEEEGTLKKRFLMLSEVFQGQVGLLHGKMRSEEKNLAMEAFHKGKCPILVSTTVIETGIHADAATTMIIEKSERFGMAQLHQLRGRVGRSQKAGHCFFLYTPPLTPVVQKRLQVVRVCHDGFIIAEKDWGFRGGGDRLGLQQSGVPSYRFIDRERDAHLLTNALPIAKQFLVTQSPHVPVLVHLFARHHAGALLAG